MQQIVQQIVRNNYVSLLIKQFVFTKLVESLNLNALWICKLYFFKAQRKFNFSINFIVQHVAQLGSSILCSVMSFVVQFYLRVRENKFHISAYCKYVVKHILWSYIHFQIFAITCIYFLPCLFKNQWNVGKDKTYMKMERKFFGTKDEHHNGWKSLTIFAKGSIFDVW